MQSVIILEKKPEATVSSEFLGKILPAYPHGMGMSVVTASGLHKQSASIAGMKPEEVLTAINQVQEQPQFKSAAMCIAFMNNSTLLEDDIQPYTLIASGGNPSLVVYIDGDFSQYAKKDSAHPPEYHYVFGEDGILPYVTHLYSMTDESKPEIERIKKLMAALEQNPAKKTFLPAGAKRAVVTLHSVSNQIYTFRQVDADSRFEGNWGWASKAHGQPDTKVAGEMKPPTLSSKLLGGLGIGTKQAEPAKAETVLKMPTTKAKEESPPWNEGDMVWVFIPPPNYSNKQLKALYHSVVGFLPKLWKQRVPVPVADTVAEQHKGKHYWGGFKQVPLKERPTMPEASDERVPGSVPTPSKKDVEPHHVPQPSSDPSPAAQPASPLEKNHEKEFVSVLIAATDKDGNKVNDPNKSEDIEMDVKWPSFTARTGYDLTVTRHWKMTARVATAKEHPELMATLHRDLWMRIEALEKQLLTKQSETHGVGLKMPVAKTKTA